MNTKKGLCSECVRETVVQTLLITQLGRDASV